MTDNKTTQCSVCLDDKPTTYTALQCEHHICSECLTEHLLLFVEKPQEDYYNIPCVMGKAECSGVYDALDIVPRVLPDTDTIQGWWDAVYQRTIMDSVGTCPYPDCAFIFELYPEDEEDNNNNFGECFECHRGICLKCETAWHEGPCSEETSREGRWQRHPADIERKRNKTKKRENSILARRLAEEKGWTRCPKCDNMVEKKNGCLTIICQCSTEFCYRCGALSSGHRCAQNCVATLHTDSKLREARKRMFRYEEASSPSSSSSSSSS